MQFKTDFRRPAFCLFGLAFDLLSMEQMLSLTRQAFRERHRIVLSTPNVNFVVAAQGNDSFRDAVVRSDLVAVDGMPLVWLARLFDIKATRLAGSNFFERVTQGDAGVCKVFFFGGGEGVAERASRRLSLASSAAMGVGGFSPGFGTIDDMARSDVLQRINQLEPDFVVVALGAAKGQAWIEKTKSELTAPLISHLGAVVNFVAGSVRRSPRFFQITGLEWIWRIIEEPSLWRRYFNDGCSIARLLFSRMLPLLIRHRRAERRPAPSNAFVRVTTRADDGAGHVCMGGDWRDADWTLLGDALNEACSVPGDLVIDARQLGWVAQSTVAQLIRLRGHQQRLGLRLTFEEPAPAFADALRLHCADYLLEKGQRLTGRMSRRRTSRPSPGSVPH